MVIRGSYCDHESIVKASEKIFSLLFDLVLLLYFNLLSF